MRASLYPLSFFCHLLLAHTLTPLLPPPLPYSPPSRYAGSEDIQLAGLKAKDSLSVITAQYMLRRTKEELNLGLHGKQEFCVLSDLKPIQWDIYAHLLSLPDFQNCANAKNRCPLHPGFHGNRKNCCDPCVRPLLRMPNGEISHQIDDHARLWLDQHAANHETGEHEACEKCPSCISLPIMHKLRCVYNDPALLQTEQKKLFIDADREKVEKRRNFMHYALYGTDLTERLGGLERPPDQDLFRDSKNRSGKLENMSALLEKFVEEGRRTLIFRYVPLCVYSLRVCACVCVSPPLY